MAHGAASRRGRLALASRLVGVGLVALLAGVMLHRRAPVDGRRADRASFRARTHRPDPARCARTRGRDASYARAASHVLDARVRTGRKPLDISRAPQVAGRQHVGSPVRHRCPRDTSRASMVRYPRSSRALDAAGVPGGEGRTHPRLDREAWPLRLRTTPVPLGPSTAGRGGRVHSRTARGRDAETTARTALDGSRAEGIEAHIHGEHHRAQLGFLGAYVDLRLMVRASDLRMLASCSRK